VIDVTALFVPAPEQSYKQVIDLLLGGLLLMTGLAGRAFRQEEATLVVDRDAGRWRAVLVLHERQLAAAVVFGIDLFVFFGVSSRRYCRKRKASCQLVEPDKPEPDLMPCKLG